MIVLKTIDMTLDPASVRRAIKEVEDFKDHLQQAMISLIEYLTERGVKVAKAQLLSFNPSAVYTRTLYESIQKDAYDPSTKSGTVYAEDYDPDHPYAIYVEYGTGIYAANGGKRHGEPWTYFNENDGRWHTTYGMPARPFMYNTLRIIQNEAETNGARVIAEYIP